MGKLGLRAFVGLMATALVMWSACVPAGTADHLAQVRSLARRVEACLDATKGEEDPIAAVLRHPLKPDDMPPQSEVVRPECDTAVRKGYDSTKFSTVTPNQAAEQVAWSQVATYD